MFIQIFISSNSINKILVEDTYDYVPHYVLQSLYGHFIASTTLLNSIYYASVFCIKHVVRDFPFITFKLKWIQV